MGRVRVVGAGEDMNSRWLFLIWFVIWLVVLGICVSFALYPNWIWRGVLAAIFIPSSIVYWMRYREELERVRNVERGQP